MAESGKEMDDWMEWALAESAVVAEMLVSLRVPHAEPPKASQASATIPGRWGMVRKRPRAVMKLRGWCYSEVRQQGEHERPIERKAEENGVGGSPLTPLSWNGCVGLCGSGGDGSDSSRDGRKVKAERMLRTAVTPDFGDGVKLKPAVREVDAPSLLSKRTAAKKRSITSLREEESRLLTENKNLEKEIKMLKENYMALLQENNRLKTSVHTQTMSSEKPAMTSPSSSFLQGIYFQKPTSAHEPRPLPSQLNDPGRGSRTLFWSSVRASGDAFGLPDLNLSLEDNDSEP